MLDLFLAMVDTEEEKQKFNEFCNRYLPYIRKIAYNLFNGHADYEDAVISTLMFFAENLDKIKPGNENSTKALVYKVTKSKSIDFLRKRNRQFAVISIDEIGSVESDIDIIDEIIEQELYDDIRKAISCLHDTYKEVLSYRLVHNLSFKQIATALDISVSSAKSKYKRGVEQVIRMLRTEHHG